MTTTLCITGIDGAGKSTIAARLAAELPSVAVASIWDSMAGGHSPFSSKKAVDDYLCSLTPGARLLFLAHALHYATEKALETQSSVVVLNAYYYKYFATEYTLGAPKALVEQLLQAFPVPDFCFRLNVPVDVAAARKQRLSRYECGLAETPDQEAFISFQERNLPAWELFGGTRFIDIDGTLPVDAICALIHSHLSA